MYHYRIQIERRTMKITTIKYGGKKIMRSFELLFFSLETNVLQLTKPVNTTKRHEKNKRRKREKLQNCICVFLCFNDFSMIIAIAHEASVPFINSMCNFTIYSNSFSNNFNHKTYGKLIRNRATNQYLFLSFRKKWP